MSALGRQQVPAVRNVISLNTGFSTVLLMNASVNLHISMTYPTNSVGNAILLAFLVQITLPQDVYPAIL